MGVRKMIGIGIGLFAGGFLWTWLWRDWGDLWKVLKGGIGLLAFFAAVILLTMGYFQWHEDSEKARCQEEEKRREQEQKAVSG